MSEWITLSAAIREAVGAFALQCAEHHAAQDPARIVFVYDEGSSTLFPLAVGVLPRAVEKKYRAGRRSDSDFQLLWNPEEFPHYATPELLLRLDAAVCDAVQAHLAEGGRFSQVRVAINAGCRDANKVLAGRDCFAFATDPELVDVRRNVAAIGNIPALTAAEMPDWF
ncbi:hypothetical protein [Tahibacter harae]|uniref:DUF4303 domain-containing protein n=1 Tax=Tahibacter harae TaxID=2963937 RepID=A0ABT1QW65_9GAMM|nr:hypothetical protein [Tahibacter harae]MCQ4166525.1 hypothetical protein [Tahibacter harae]